MRQLTWWSLAITALTLMGCAGSGKTPLAPTAAQHDPIAPEGLGAIIQHQGTTEAAMALYTIDLDPQALTATATLMASRAIAANDDLYDLALDQFMRRDSLTITSITTSADDIVLSYAVSHPFAAVSDLDAPTTAKNRCDLGIAGRVLFLLDSQNPTADTFFDESGTGGGRVIANTAAVSNADGYYAPGAVIPNSLVANTFPYKVLVDETLNPRTSTAGGAPISNGDSATGNFDPVLGWQRSSLGAGRDGWTGMGMLHQGQTAKNTVTIAKSAVEAMGFSFNVGIDIKYSDPRGGATGVIKRSNRIPQETTDLAAFAYRMPHGSLDVESIRFAGESGGFRPNEISASTLRFHVVDWDARAIETTESDLADDTSSASLVSPNESGAPTLAVCIPGVIGASSHIVTLAGAALEDDDELYGGDTTLDSGYPGDPLFYAESVTKSVIGAQLEGIYTGMVRATDVEANFGTPLVVAIDAGLQPLTANIPKPISYQAFNVLLDDPNTLPSITLTTPANVLSATSTIATLTSAFDAEGQDITVELDFNNDGVYETNQVISAPYSTPIVFNSPVSYNNATLAPTVRTIPARFKDSAAASWQPYGPALTFQLGANRPPQISGNPSLQSAALASPATFTMIAGFSSISDPEGDAITRKVTNNVDASVVSGTFPIGGLGPYVNPGTPSVDFTLWATDALHPGTGAGPVDGNAFAPATGTVIIGNSIPTISLTTPAAVLSGTSTTMTLTFADDFEAQDITIEIDWDNDTVYEDSHLISSPYTTPVVFSSTVPKYNNTTLSTLPRNIPVRFQDSAMSSPQAYSPTLTFDLGPNRAPQIISGVPALQTATLLSPATFTLLQNTANVVDPEGNPVTYRVTNNQNATVVTSAFPIGGLGPYLNPGTPTVQFTLWATDALHPATGGGPVNGTSFAAVTGTINAPCTPNITQATYAFTSGLDGWTQGHIFIPVVNNSDVSLANSRFWRCSSKTSQGAGFSGNCITTGPSWSGCGSGETDYGINVDNNMIGPNFSLVGRTRAELIFNSSKSGRAVAAAHYRIWVSTDNGGTWPLSGIVYDTTKLTSGILNETNVTVDLTAFAGMSNLRLRVQFADTTNSTYSAGSGNFAGWGVDNIRLMVCP